MNCEKIIFKNKETSKEKEYVGLYEMYYTEQSEQYTLTTIYDGKKKTHVINAKKWYIVYVG